MTTEPTRVGHVVSNNAAGVTSVTLTPDGTIADGDWMILTYMAAAAVTPATPAGWTLLAATAVVGTRTAAVWGKIRGAGETGYTVTISSAVNGSQFTLSWGTGADAISSWIAGTPTKRSTSSAVNTAASITTTAANNLVLVVSMEASTASEADITSISGATKWFFEPQTTTPQIHTTLLGYIDQATAGATAGVTITYPNASGNGWAVQIALPPAPSASAPALIGVVSDSSGTIDWYDMFQVQSDLSLLPIEQLILPTAQDGDPWLHDTFSRYFDGQTPTFAYTGQLWQMYSGPGLVTGGLYDSTEGTGASYLHATSPGEVVSMKMRFKFDTMGGTRTGATSSAILMVWGNGGVSDVTNRTARMHLAVAPNGVTYSTQPSHTLVTINGTGLSPNLALDTWHEVEVFLSGTTATTYINGVLKLTSTDSFIADAPDMRDVCFEPYYNSDGTDARCRISEVWAEIA